VNVITISPIAPTVYLPYVVDVQKLLVLPTLNRYKIGFHGKYALFELLFDMASPCFFLDLDTKA